MIEKKCAISGEKFVITADDLKFYAKMEIISAEDLADLESGKIADCVGLPTLCPTERYIRRLSWRNERKLYKRKCDGTGKIIISIHDESAKYPVYENQYWWSDNWEALDYGKDFDGNVAFFAQFKSLLDVVPQISILNDNGTMSQNCQYCQDFVEGKNCYFMFESGDIQDSMFCNHSSRSTEIFDCYDVLNSELVYESSASKHLYNCRFLSNSHNCSDCDFGLDLIGCKNCFGCVNLRNKEYYFLNEKCTKEAYERKISDINIGDGEKLDQYRKNFVDFCKKIPQRAANIRASENCVGQDIFHSKNCLGFGVFHSENCRYVQNTDSQKNSYDNQGWKSEWTLETQTCDESWETAFSLWCMSCKNVLYSSDCHNCEHCFGCVGLRHKKFCILNKQYSEAEYFKLKEKIIASMRKTREWGEFFPTSLSPFSYNETVANEYFPLTKKEVLEKNYAWKDEKITTKYKGEEYEISANIGNVSDEILKKVLFCERTERPYKIQKAELKFYKKMNLPVPRLHPDERHKDRMKLRNPRKLWSRNCGNCNCELRTTFDSDRPEKILCEQCYLNVID